MAEYTLRVDDNNDAVICRKGDRVWAINCGGDQIQEDAAFRVVYTGTYAECLALMAERAVIRS